MRTFISLVIAAFALVIAQPADITGTWVGKRAGTDVEYVWEFKVADGKITGTQKLPNADAPIVDGHFDGNQFEFTVEMDTATGPQRQVVKGEIAGDELHITLPAFGRGRGGAAQGPIVAKRGTPTPTYRAGSVNYSTLPKVDLPALRKVPYDGLAKTPPMGWNSWNKFRTRIDARTVREIADAMVSSGMRDAGYQFINIDDGWEWKRGEDGVLQPNPKFPDMKALADYLHSKGLKLGIYSSPGPRTCGGYEGSYGHEEIDARTWASWGIDYLKYDWCSASRIWQDDAMPAVYQRMGEALRATGRPIVFSLCQYGRAKVQEWGPNVGGNLWRTTGDIRDSYDSMAKIGFSQSDLAPFAGPGHWNDPDMLEVGNGGMSTVEYQTHFSLWALLAAPLIAGNDLRAMNEETKSVLLNREVIAIDQDPLGRAATRVKSDNDTDVWMRPLARGAYAVGLFNRGAASAEVTVTWAELNLRGPFRVRDLWAHADRGRSADAFTATVPSHGVVLLRLAK